MSRSLVGFKLMSLLTCVFDYLIFLYCVICFSNQAQQYIKEFTSQHLEEQTEVLMTIELVNLFLNLIFMAPRLYIFGLCVVSSFYYESVQQFAVFHFWSCLLVLLEYFGLILFANFNVLYIFIPVVDIIFTYLVWVLARSVIDDDYYMASDKLNQD